MTPTSGNTDDLLLCLFGIDGSGGPINCTMPGSMTAYTERDVGGATYRIASEQLALDSATGTRTATASSTQPWFAVSVLIKGAGAGGGASTGEKFPTSGTTTNESPWLDEPWVNPGNVVSNNATYAAVTATTFDLGDQTAVLKAFGFDFSSIPAGATIDGVTARIEARGDSTSVSLDLVQLLDTSGAKVGTNLASTPQALTTSDAVYTFGSSSNLVGQRTDRCRG